MSNLPAARPVAPSTATKKGRAVVGKCKVPTNPKEKPQVAKKPGKKTTPTEKKTCVWPDPAVVCKYVM